MIKSDLVLKSKYIWLFEKNAFGTDFLLWEVPEIDYGDDDDDGDDNAYDVMCFLHPKGSQTKFAPRVVGQ